MHLDWTEDDEAFRNRWWELVEANVDEKLDPDSDVLP